MYPWSDSLHPPQITELAGYTSRVSEMLHVFEEVDKGHYEVVSVAEEVGEKKESREQATGKLIS